MSAALSAALRLYLVVHRTASDLDGLLALTQLAVQGGVSLVQLRSKQQPDRAFYEDARALAQLLRELAVPFVVNDRADLAALIPGAGVHLGQNDLPVAAARRLLGPERLIGVSVDTPAEAAVAAAEGANYLGAGPAFPTLTKLDAGPLQSAENLARIVGASALPVVAIGGIHAGNAALLRGLGLAGIAVSSAVCAAPDPRQAAGEVGRAFWGD